MNFEEKLKKRLIKQLNKDVPNPYSKKRFSLWPLWAKIALPVGSVALTGCIVAAIIVPNVTKNNNVIAPIDNPIVVETFDPLPNEGFSTACAPKNTRMIPNLERSFVNRTSTKTIQNLENYFADKKNKNCVLSPASYLLTISAVAAVSDNFNLEAFGLEDAGEDTKTFLEALNCSYTSNNITMSQYDAGVLHQQVGPSFKFVEEKRQQVSDYYIGTAVANRGNYMKQAEEYFSENVGITIPIPDPRLPNDGVITYGALKMHDHCDAFATENNDFYVDNNPISVPTGIFGTKEKPKTTAYYQSENYLAFRLRIYSTEMIIVLPNEGVSLESISISEAYQSYLNEHLTSTRVYGYIPYFHLQTLSVDLTENVLSRFSGNELLYSKLLEEGMIAGNSIIRCLQSSDFQFSDKGIDAQSVTVFGAGSGAMPPQSLIEINVNRPFYAITLRDNFPLFICKVNNPIA